MVLFCSSSYLKCRFTVSGTVVFVSKFQRDNPFARPKNSQKSANRGHILEMYQLIPTPRQNGSYFPYEIFRCIFLYERFRIFVSLKFVPKVSIDTKLAVVVVVVCVCVFFFFGGGGFDPDYVCQTHQNVKPPKLNYQSRDTWQTLNSCAFFFFFLGGGGGWSRLCMSNASKCEASEVELSI